MNLYAHSLENKPQEAWQSLDSHLKNVAELSAKFAEEFQSSDWSYNIGLLHDLGKALPTFQSYLLRQNGLDDPHYDFGNHNHSSAGAAFAIQKFGECIGKIYAYLAAGHHAGLPDWYPDKTGNAALSCRLMEGNENLTKIKDYLQNLEKFLRTSKKPDFVNSKNLHLWIRMLFSCLVDADSLDTEKFYEPEKSTIRANFAKIEDLKEKFDAYMQRFVESKLKNELNKIRSEILSACREKARVKEGIFSLSVPTGGGKTLSSMAFALEHAIKFNKKRIIYAIPYTSIIEQTANIFKEIFGNEQVLEHHCNIDSENQPLKMELASENWDAPIIVTTNVQFFESLYAAKRSRCRKLHNIVNSVVILDETQLLPPEFLAPCVWAIKELSQNYGVTVLLSTATQPSLKWLENVEEIIQNPEDLYRKLERVEYHFPDNLQNSISWEQLADELLKHRQVLCIVNTRKDCHELHSLMPENTFHLSALMCGEHRSDVIAEIKTKLKNNEEVRVISTQLVEAGVDIDFPVVYRALSGFDSIVQAAGRCNREGKLQKGKVFIFIPLNSSLQGILGKAENASKELLTTKNFDMHSPETFKQFFKKFYDSLNNVGEEDFYRDLIQDGLAISFRSYAEKFKLVDDQDSRTIIVLYGKSSELISELKKIGKPTRNIMRQLQRYTVNIHQKTFNAMLANGLIEEVIPKSNIFAQTLDKIYLHSTGLDIYSDSLPASDLIL